MKTIELEIWQDGFCVASVIAPEHDAIREARHYAMIYGQDGPIACYQYFPHSDSRLPFAIYTATSD